MNEEDIELQKNIKQEEIPKIEESSGFNFLTSIWIVPFIALIIAGWLAFQYFSQLGEEIVIVFPKNEGLVAGQSVLKFRNVPVGKVTKITIQEDTDGVMVYVRMNEKSSTPYLTEKAKFWIVKPELGISGVSGLDTLISGTYINIYSEVGGTFQKEYIGLVQPYRDSTGGEYFVLNSPTGDKVSVGTPIYYKNIKVGEIEHLYLSNDSLSINAIIFVDKEYIGYIHDDSKFWLRNIVSVDISRGNLNLSIAPFKQIIQGGIIFSSSGDDKTNPVTDRYIFTLYKNETEAQTHKKENNHKKVKREFILFTNKSICNLKVESPIKFNGFDIGSVKDIDIYYDKKSHKLQSEIIFEIDTSIFVGKDENLSKGVDNLYTAIKEGLRAKIGELNPISKMQFIDLVFDTNASSIETNQTSSYDIFLISNQEDEKLMTKVSKILESTDKLLESSNKLIEDINKPTVDMLKDMDRLILNLNKIIDKKSFRKMPDEVNKALRELTKTLKVSKRVIRGYGSKSLAGRQLSQTLKVITRTTIEMRDFLKMLNRNPNALIFGDK
ncbi:MAG: MlaD family protein [Sulfurovum sp.]